MKKTCSECKKEFKSSHNQQSKICPDCVRNKNIAFFEREIASMQEYADEKRDEVVQLNNIKGKLESAYTQAKANWWNEAKKYKETIDMIKKYQHELKTLKEEQLAAQKKSQPKKRKFDMDPEELAKTALANLSPAVRGAIIATLTKKGN